MGVKKEVVPRKLQRQALRNGLQRIRDAHREPHAYDDAGAPTFLLDRRKEGEFIWSLSGSYYSEGYDAATLSKLKYAAHDIGQLALHGVAVRGKVVRARRFERGGSATVDQVVVKNNSLLSDASKYESFAYRTHNDELHSLIAPDGQRELLRSLARLSARQILVFPDTVEYLPNTAFAGGGADNG